ncbi:MAG: gliding motility-associated C-terminal domain-containing protein [Bacteroidetes bacterium]|nr:gliding motility-associated C-terminal domain-containing protein [Bacteroidota bacterium]
MFKRYPANLPYRILFFILLCGKLFSPENAMAQPNVIWTETFGTSSTPCDAGTLANGFYTVNPSQAWSVDIIGTQGSFPNIWYVSAAEPGKDSAQCSTQGCDSFPGVAINRTLHIGNMAGSPLSNSSVLLCPSGDCGAMYDFGDWTGSGVTNIRAVSPKINLLGNDSIRVYFSYLEHADINNADNCIFEYYDGSTWTPLGDPARTNACSANSSSYKWSRMYFDLPHSACNNPNVKIGFRWYNDSDGGGENPSFAVDSIVVVSLVTPFADFTASDTTICAGDAINFFADSSTHALSYSWTFIGGSPGTSSAMNPTNITFPNPGDFGVQLIVSSGAASDTMDKANFIHVLSCTAPHADFLASDTVICERDCITMTDMSTGGATSWLWSFPGGNPSSSTLPDPTVCYQDPGTYTITLVAGNQYGTDTVTKIDYIVADTCTLPQGDFYSSLQTACAPSAIEFDGVVVTGGPFTSWSWYFPGATPDTSSLQNPTGIVCNADGFYDVMLIVSNQYGSDTIIKYSYMHIESVPGAYVCPDTAMYFGSSYQMYAGGGLTYAWNPYIGIDSVYSQTPIASPSETTTYTCTISDGTCYTKRQVVVTILHNNDLFLPNTFSPNGDNKNDYFFLRGNNIYGIRLTIFDRWGEKMFESTDPSQGWDGTYNNKDVNPGVYTFVATVIFTDGTSASKSGTVTLVR